MSSPGTSPAKKELTEAAWTPGSELLASLGPNVSLASIVEGR
jgi:hypothetical protein